MAGADTLAKFKTYLNTYPITLNYQLAIPVTTTYPLRIFENGVAKKILMCYGPNTTIIQNPVSIVEGKPNASNQMTLPGTETLDSLTLVAYRNDGTVNDPVWVDVKANASLNTSTRVVTISSANQTKDYFVAVDVDTSGSTVGTISYKTPVNAIVTIPNRIEVGMK